MRSAGCIALAAVLFVRSSYAADTCVQLRAEGFTSEQVQETEKHLRYALAHRGMAPCDAANSASAALVVEVSNRTSDLAIVRAGSLTKQVDLHDLPPDARPLAIAQVLDEIVRAATDRAQAPHAAPDAPQRPAPQPLDAGVGVAFEQYTTGYRQLGPDLTARVWFTEYAGLSFRGGFRKGSAFDTPHGTVETLALTGDVGARLRRNFGGNATSIELGPSLFASRFSFDPIASGTSSRAAMEANATSLHLALEGAVRARFKNRGFIGLLAVLGVPLSTARLLAGTTRLDSIGGALIGAQIELGVSF